MENIVVSTFDLGENASQALNKFKELDQIGDIIIYNIAMIHKTGEKQFELLYQDGPEMDAKPVAGMLVGTAVGAVAGPAGMAIGLLTGALMGSADQKYDQDFSNDFLTELNDNTRTGNYVIVLDLEEDGEFIVNSYMESYHGVTVHSNILDQYDRYDHEQWKELNDEIADSEKSLKTALDKDKASIQAKINKLKIERAEKREEIKKKATDRMDRLKAKLRKIDEKIKAAEGKAKEKLKGQEEKANKELKKFNEDVDWAFNDEVL